ncbi:hypothetical protein KI387_042519 [Taxus chinensis]|uniref:Glycerol-3-phosphate acyltransferase RAM2/GPAT1-8 HAD-like domain-containing protein n=1 Tax=Taxus chinensis TaxID=29808 RepID=A0AA38C0U8_TAXCH|nr:hypothetical protein KI387_042519 [Taxus chinensis]
MFRQAEEVIGTEIEVNRFGRATGFVKVPGVLLGLHKRFAVKALFGDATPTVGLGREIPVERSFMALCQESYVVPANQRKDTNRRRASQAAACNFFHDGRLVRRPTPLSALLILIYIPLGMFLAIFRILAGFLLPIWAIHHTSPYLGGKIIVNGEQPQASSRSNAGRPRRSVRVHPQNPAGSRYPLHNSEAKNSGRNVFDFSSVGAPLSYSDGEADPPEGTRRRQHKKPSAERRSGGVPRRNHLQGAVPVALQFSLCRAFRSDCSRRHGLSRELVLRVDCQGMEGDGPLFFFFMNPRPEYRVTFLKQIPHRLTCSAGKSPHEVANYVQRLLARTLGFECTGLTRREKYSILAGNDGTVSSSSSRWLGLFTHRAQN